MGALGPGRRAARPAGRGDQGGRGTGGPAGSGRADDLGPRLRPAHQRRRRGRGALRRAGAPRRRGPAAGAPTEARELVTRALALWRGPEPLADVPGPAARTARTRLTRLRLALHTKRAELDLLLGDHDRAADDLAGLLRAHPHREDFRRLYLLALRRQGRGEEALEVYEEYELSGGRSPALVALGRELREEHTGPADEGPWEEYEAPAKNAPSRRPPRSRSPASRHGRRKSRRRSRGKSGRQKQGGQGKRGKRGKRARWARWGRRHRLPRRRALRVRRRTRGRPGPLGAARDGHRPAGGQRPAG
ncbi:hypothetical protein ID867_16560 [Streptomyces parvulus]|nr:hypothetical protein [Streptomyces parvulus]